MHDAGAIDEDVGRALPPHHLLREGIDGGGRAHVERVAPRRGEAFELAGIEIGREHSRALGDEGFADGTADALPRGGDERDLAIQSVGHCITRSFGARPDRLLPSGGGGKPRFSWGPTLKNRSIPERSSRSASSRIPAAGTEPNSRLTSATGHALAEPADGVTHP